MIFSKLAQSYLMKWDSSQGRYVDTPLGAEGEDAISGDGWLLPLDGGDEGIPSRQWGSAGTEVCWGYVW